MTTIKSVSVSEMADFQTCRCYWWWSAYGPDGSGGLSPKQFQLALFIGNGVHAGLEAFYRKNKSREKALAAVDRWLQSESQSIFKQTPYGEKDLVRQIESASQLIRGMIANYVDFDNDPDQLLIEPIAVIEGKPSIERRIRVPIRHPDSGEETGVVLSGRIDLILGDLSSLTIVDHKTYGSEPDFRALDIDEQITCYYYLLYRLTGEVAYRAIYNCLIKQIPQPPERLQRGGFSKAKSQMTTYEVYRRALEASGEPIEKYVDILNHLAAQRWGAFFKQQETTRNISELDAFERRVFYRVEEMQRVADDPSNLAYPTPSTRGCMYCPFREPCKAADDGGDSAWLLNTYFTKRNY